MRIRRSYCFCLALLALCLFSASQASAQILDSKRGFADTNASYNDLQATDSGWYYTWGTGPASPGTYNANFYPMFWSAPSQGTINSVKSTNPQYVLGFNEPEVATQSNMTVAQAITSWTAISTSFTGTTTKLVSPAVSDDGAGQQWLASFMSTAKTDGLKVDAVAFHWYGVSTPTDPAGAASSFLSRVDSYHNSYGLPVFITEFAIHDWGGAYTDQQIIDANQTFLSIVIPGLESRSYVAGYSWYNWFSDDPLYTTSGSTLTPTQESYNYIGALGTGTTTDIGGQNLGEHVADMTGGTLTMSSAATIKYINALSGTSSISGTVDWGLAGTGNWVRIQPGATLVKSGANQVTFSSGTVTNNGVLQVSQGTLKINSPVTGGGTFIVKGGTLALASSGNLSATPLVDVRPAGTFDISAANFYTVASGRSLNMDGNGVGNFTAGNGSTVSGGGVFQGNLTAQAGSVIRVGTDGSGVATRYLVDNFESYALGDVGTVAGPSWTEHQAFAAGDIVNYNGDKVLAFGSATDFRGVSRTLPTAAIIDNSSTDTYFFRVNSQTDTPNHNVGLGDKASTATVDFNDFEPQLRLKQGTTAGTFAIDARNGGAFSATLASNLALNTWYNIWMVVNQTTDKYDIYMNTGTGAATTASKLNATPLSFRNGTTTDLNEFLALAGAAPVADGVRLDDIVFQTGTDLTNPEAGFNPGMVWTPSTLTVNGNYIQNPVSTLQLNIQSPNSHDQLHVLGQATLSGTLNVTYAIGAPSPHAGDVYQLLNTSSMTGTFATLQLPALGGTLLWDSSQLYTTGSISIFSDLTGDFNQDGVVSPADIQAMMLALSDKNAYESQYNMDDFELFAIEDIAGDGQFNNADIQSLITLIANSATGGGTLTAVPEPASIALLGLGLGGLLLMFRRALWQRTVVSADAAATCRRLK